MEKKKTPLIKILVLLLILQMFSDSCLRLKNNIFAHAYRFTVCISLYDYASML
jgi:hypothetical protein